MQTPTLLMNRTKSEDGEKSVVPLDEEMNFKYNTNYSYEDNRKKIKELQTKELKIRSALARFNSVTKVADMDITIAEALVRIGQLKGEISVIANLANKTEYTNETLYGNSKVLITKICYDQNKAKEDLRELQRELSAI